MHAAGPNNPLHGITLEMMLTRLHAYYGWDELGDMIRINCFNSNPSIKSSLTFLRRTPWARQKVEDLYLYRIDELTPPSDIVAAAPAAGLVDERVQQPEAADQPNRSLAE
jgi:uncharacterized protein (DUF2132 family)